MHPRTVPPGRGSCGTHRPAPNPRGWRWLRAALDTPRPAPRARLSERLQLEEQSPAGARGGSRASGAAREAQVSSEEGGARALQPLRVHGGDAVFPVETRLPSACCVHGAAGEARLPSICCVHQGGWAGGRARHPLSAAPGLEVLPWTRAQ